MIRRIKFHKELCMGRKDQPLKRPNSEGTRHGGGAKLVFSSLVLEASAVAMVASTGACI